jgi:hypothetical protein
MTQDEIIEMVRQSDLGFLLGDSWMLHHELEYFAKLVAAKEREATIKIIRETPFSNWFQVDLVEAIRTRGDA